ncbi:MAG: hypothetical protein KDB00_10825 [Planctomycetales bacterium]|nr:hypothetical protein [Planctomycetales bacterium]
MAYEVDQNAVNVIYPVRIRSDAGAAIDDLVYNSVGLSIDYLPAGASVWVSIPLVTAVLGVWTEGGFIAMPGGDGWYEIGMPNAAIIADKTTLVRVKTSGNGYRYGDIAATACCEVDVPAVDNSADPLGLSDAMNEPRSATIDGQSVTNRSINELIAGDRYQNAKQAKGPGFGIALTRLRPGSGVGE